MTGAMDRKSLAYRLSHGSAAKKSTIQEQAPPALAIDALFCVFADTVERWHCLS
jgi:hypothetical protein